MRTVYASITPYAAKDGSQIRELMHPARHRNRNQSLAEATVTVGAKTLLHRHRVSEEIYHVTAGEGTMTLGERAFAVSVGDTVCIAPGTPHCIANTGSIPLTFLCACSPAYSHDDTELLDSV